MSVSLRFAERKTILVIVDLVIVNLTTLLALWIMAVRAGWLFDAPFILSQLHWFVFLSALWLILAFLNGFYEPQKIVDLNAAISALLRIVALAVVAYLLIYFFLATPGSLPRGIVFYQGISSFILIGLWRAVYLLVVRQPTFARKVIIVGAGWAGQTIAQAIFQHASAYYQIVGFVDDDPMKQGKPISLPATRSARGQLSAQPVLPIIGNSRDLVRRVKENQSPEVILAITHDVNTAMFQALLDCKEQGVQLTLMPVLFEQLTGRVPIEHVGDNWNVTLPLDSAEAGGLYPVAKRMIDLTGALIGLALYLPILFLIAPASYLDSPGPIFYSQERVG